MHTITVVPISTGDQSLLTVNAQQRLLDAQTLVLRTDKHPLSKWLQQQGCTYTTLDHLYECADDFDTFNTNAAKTLIGLARENDVLYAVSDITMDSTVAALQKQLEGTPMLTLLPGVSHADRCLALAGQSASLADGLAVQTAEAFRNSRYNPSLPLMLGEIHSRQCAGECKLKLMDLLPDDTHLLFFTGDQNGELSSSQITLVELDRQNNYDHLTACFIPAIVMQVRTRYNMDDLVAVMMRLRAPDGCPWDIEQTHESLLTNLLEESYEYIGAVRDGDTDHMYDELGDVLLQVVFHAEIARQHGDFDITDVTTAITHKMIERHPHIFGAVKADTADQVLDNWEAIKRSQRGIKSVAEAMEDVSTGLSPTMRASKVQHKAAKIGFDFPTAVSALTKVHEEADEVQQCFTEGLDPEIELGDLLFSIVNVCRLSNVNPDISLFTATNKFINRFRNMEISVRKAGKSIEDLTLCEMDVYWEAEKHVK